MSTLKGKTLFITGGSRGIGQAIALRAARDGAQITIAAKTIEPHPKLPGTIYSAAQAIEAAGGQALACQMDIRYQNQVEEAVSKTVQHFGGVDILVNNASAISLTDTAHTSLKRFDLMQQVNTRGTFVCSQACLPYLQRAENPHILTLAPPLAMEPRWFAPHLAYTLSKYGMSACVLGMAEEFRASGIAINALWPKTLIATAAVRNLLGGEKAVQQARTPEIVAEAAYSILTRPSREFSGNFCIDEEILRADGVTDFSHYAVDPEKTLIGDLFL